MILYFSCMCNNAFHFYELFLIPKLNYSIYIRLSGGGGGGGGYLCLISGERGCAADIWVTIFKKSLNMGLVLPENKSLNMGCILLSILLYELDICRPFRR